MNIGILTGLADMDQLAGICRQMDVDNVILGLGSLPEFKERGYATCRGIAELKDDMARLGVRLEGITPPNPSREAVLGENESEVENLCRNIKAIGEAGVEIVHFYPLDRFKNYRDEYHHEKPPLEVMPGDHKWGKIIAFFQRLAEASEGANAKVSNHVFAIDVLMEILDSVGSPAIGATYCTGNYMFGHDPYASINMIGIERIFVCHARNLVRHGPGRQGHEEVPLDRGDIDIAKYIRILAEAKYNGLIIPEHWGENGNLADSVAYLKKLMACT
jgi:sugar phosphate isomerase/epimerase